jgi:hypothetical protein
MIETTLALGDLIAAIPALYEQAKLPLGVISLVVAAVSGGMALHRGVGTAIGKVVGGSAVAALIFSGLSLSNSITETVDGHSGQPGILDISTGYIQ